MSRAVTFAARADVEVALTSPDLEPPARPPSLGAGATADLRDGMARFSSGEVHRARRVDIERAISALSTSEVTASAARRTAARLDGARVDAVADLARHVPTEALAEVLGTDMAHPELTRNLARVAEVIGRGVQASHASDAAAARLLDLFRAHPLGTVPVVSLLYQNHDATAELLAATVLSRQIGQPRRCAVVRTVRVAARDALVGDRRLREGTTVVLDLETSGLELGAGPHRCPGREIAEAIVEGALAAISEKKYRLLPELVVIDDGRPLALPMEPR